MVATYRYALGAHSVGPEWGFEPRDVSMTFYLSGQAHEATFTLDANTPAGLAITELEDDIWIWRDNQVLFRGPVIQISDTGDANEHTISVTANSYRYRLSRLYTNLTDTYASGSYLLNNGTAANAPTLAWDLISHHLGSSAATGQTDLFSFVKKGTFHTPSATGIQGSVADGTDIASALDSLAQVQHFDWDMLTTGDGNVYFTAWQPGRGTARPDVAFTYIRGNPGTNCTFTRDLDVSNYANRVYVNGANTSGTQFVAFANGSWEPAGRYTLIEDGTDIASDQLQARADQLLISSQVPTAAYTITPNEGLWGGPDALWLGDQPTLIIRSGRLSEVQTTLSINEITLSPADGAEAFSFTAGAKPYGQFGEKKLARGLLDMTTTIRALGWQQTAQGS